MFQDRFSETKQVISIAVLVTPLLSLCVVFGPVSALAQETSVRISFLVVDPSGRPLPGARLVLQSQSGTKVVASSAGDGSSSIAIPTFGAYIVHATATGFNDVTKQYDLSASTGRITVRFDQVSATAQEIVVSANVSDIELNSPDPSQKIMVREELLDANPGRPGAPISLPGLPTETAAGGIKAPQYFVPGVAGDHGEPIGQYTAIGGYLAPNNLSANAHGNGYADPNVYITAALGSVGTDGGAFNVLEGNHALNLAATYNLRPRLGRFVTLTGDYRDADLTAGFSPSDPSMKEWLALEVNYGDGLMRTLEHRKQFKFNAMRVFDPGRHEITLVAIGYWGHSHEGNLVPIGYATEVNDTLDSRQQDQTHTAMVAADDHGKIGAKDEVGLSGFFRTYNLALYSNFGEGLIRQSEFRTAEGTEARESHIFTPWFEATAGLDYNEDDIHRDNLDHYLSSSPEIIGPFLKVLSNDIAIREVAPFAALRGEFGKHLYAYAGLRHELVQLDNVDKLKPEQSSDRWQAFENPKATLTWTPSSALRWLPSASLSIGQGFFTEDPRISVAKTANISSPPLASPFERSHSEQLVLEKELASTDVRVTLGHTTTTAALAKIDPDNGLAEDEGPGTLKFLTASLGHQFSFGMAQAVFSKADARDNSTGQPAREAPRTIFDLLTTLDKIPLGLRARGEYEYVGHKLLDIGNSTHLDPYEAIPVGETRLALVRQFSGRLTLGVNGEITRGYTGQTTETMDPGWTLGKVPYCAPGSGPSGLLNDFNCGTNEQTVGVRMVSWIGGSISWRFGEGK